MTSDEALANAIDVLKMASYYEKPNSAEARAKGAQVWLNIAEFLREKE